MDFHGVDVPSLDEAANAIERLHEARAGDATVCPSEAARALNPVDWRACMPVVHDAAKALVARGEVVLTQGGIIKQPHDIVGAYRIRRRSIA